ncbi:hypothetical protein KEM52_004918 [Ascosphaera acerosa]|nr:hypothetical protein KEM52_004918 [Ascosphaera acerosa]
MILGAVNFGTTFLGLYFIAAPPAPLSVPDTPVCDRCHHLKNHGVAAPIPCPPLSDIRDLIEASPHQYNHVYHIIDAADFPLSLIPDIYSELDLQGQRSRNRRAKLSRYEGGHRKTVISFVITRSDLLGATKEQVDHYMPYVVGVLREKLGIKGDAVRLGNVHMVSSHRGWWTKEVKEKIKDHADGVWMVGKTNVGKSSLLAAVFPKQDVPATTPKPGDAAAVAGTMAPPPAIPLAAAAAEPAADGGPESGLPPAQPHAQFPSFPIVSSVPGTTALPIRVPFPHAKGEVIDLPGLSRDGLEPYIQDDRLPAVIMDKRVKPDRLTVKPGQSLLLGGLVRITPSDPDLLILAASFCNLPAHVTATSKAIALQTQASALPGVSVAKDGVGTTIAPAGAIALADDVTRIYGQYDKYRETLPYAVLATDILIEGCGWVEVIAQVRRKQLESGYVPSVEVFSPHGKHIGSRPSMSAFSRILEKQQKSARRRKSRPRKSMRRARLTSRGPLRKQLS